MTILFNLSFSYKDLKNNVHNVFYRCCNTFNTMRFASEYPLAGTALWRLGSEDARIWNHYNKDLSNAILVKN